MPKVVKALCDALSLAVRPISANASFFFFMYALGCVSSWAVLPDSRGAKVYDNLYLELLLDTYVVCIVLSILPLVVRRWVRGLLYVALYATSVIDVYCFVKFQSTLTPSMLMLVGETDPREAGEFLRSCVSPGVITSSVGWVLLLLIVHVLTALRLKFPHIIPHHIEQKLCKIGKLVAAFASRSMTKAVTGLVIVVMVVWAAVVSADNKQATWKLMSGTNIGEVEHTLTEQGHAQLYLPAYRLVFSVYANSLAAKQIDKLIAGIDKVKVDSCSYKSPTIVLIIGESYSRHHSAMYGYTMPTTPRQQKLERQGRLVKFTDVVSPHNLTSFVFKNVFSTRVEGQKGEWCDYPLFTEVFRKAGYHVTFLTNQFLPKVREAVYDFSGGFFLNNPTLSAAQFDTRNDRLHTYDEGLLEDYDQLKGQGGDNNLIIFHLIGQHVSYRQRSPKDRKHFKGDDYKELKPNLDARERRILADYDNAVLYNDSVVDCIVDRFEHEDAIVIYMPDHGEECYEGDMHFFCRMHSAEIDARLAHAEFDIPFWIWCSPKYARRRPEVFKAIVQARNRRFMTDALPHLLFDLAGISAPCYNSKYDLISPDYDETRPRLLKGTTDYDKLKGI